MPKYPHKIEMRFMVPVDGYLPVIIDDSPLHEQWARINLKPGDLYVYEIYNMLGFPVKNRTKIKKYDDKQLFNVLERTINTAENVIEDTQEKATDLYDQATEYGNLMIIGAALTALILLKELSN